MAEIREVLSGVLDAAALGNFNRSGLYDRLDGKDVSSAETVYYFPRDLETAYDMGHLVEFTVYVKKSAEIEKSVGALSGKSESSSRISGQIEKMKKYLEEYSPDSGKMGRYGKDNYLARRDAVNSLEMMIKSDPNAINEDGSIHFHYQKFLQLDSNSTDPRGPVAPALDALVAPGGISHLKKLRGYAVENAAAKAAEEAQYQQTATESRLAAAGLEPTGEVVRMYLPGGVNFSDEVSYKGVDFGLIKGILDANPGIILPKAMNAVASFADTAGTFLGQDLNTVEAIEALTGGVRNSRSEQLFEGQSVRTFSFEFNFRPRNKQEAAMMKSIVDLFRFHMRPELGSGEAYYLTPSEFEIKFYDISRSTGSQTQGVIATGSPRSTDGSSAMLTENKFLPKIRMCALNSLSINTSPDEIMETFSDPEHSGTPVSMTMNLTFSEKQEISRQDIAKGY